MYTSFIGKKFLTAWNAREGRALTARQFFDEEMFPLFFDDERHLLHVSNSAFFQSLSAKDLASGKREAEIRRENLHFSIQHKRPNASFYVGYSAEDATATTSGQVTSMPLAIEAEEIYASWIGEALACSVSGGFYLLFDREEILFGVHEGWKVYRNYLRQTPSVKGRQIETWNGHWLRYWLAGDYEVAFFPHSPEAAAKGDIEALTGLKWPDLVLTLCRRYPNDALTVYAYNLASTNTTLGFLNLKLPEVHRLYELRDQYFLDKKRTILSDREIQQLEPLFGFKRAAEFGAIGLRAMEPNKLREYLPQRGDKKPRDFNPNDDKTAYQFHLFKLWIYAMLNKTELLVLAGQVARHLLALEEKSERGKAIYGQLSTDVRSATSLRNFVDKLAEVLEEYGKYKDLQTEAAATFREVVEQAVKMSADHFPLFVALLRFEYQAQKIQPQNTLFSN